MKDFIKVFWKFGVIAVIMFLVAVLCYTKAYQDPAALQKRTEDIAAEMDRLYNQKPGSSESQQELERRKRTAIQNDLRQEQSSEFTRLMYEHLAEALLLAGFMIVTVEGLTRYLASRELLDNTEVLSGKFREQANHVSKNVWNAIFERLVTDEIATEIKRVLKSDVCRLRPSYTVILSNQDYSDVPEGFVIVKRQMFYRLLNLTGGAVTNSIKVQTSNTTVGDMIVTSHDGAKVTLPRISKVTIQRAAQMIQPTQRVNFSKEVTLPKMNDKTEAWEVYSEVEGPFLATDRALYVLTAPCDGLEVKVINQMPDRVAVQEEEIYLTCGPDRLSLTTPQSWICEGGLLTGTALSVPWRAVPKKDATSHTAGAAVIAQKREA